LGSAITYQRRYALGAILNLNIDEDDDGNQASARPKKVDIGAVLKELDSCTTMDKLREVWNKVPTSERTDSVKNIFAAKREVLEGGAA
jgi:hypothetical protein